jgi:class 3 adenylate cyclase/HEAT repeat protein
MSPGAQESPRLGAEPLKTTHRILETFDRNAGGLEWLHGDLFDSRADVALSAMGAVASLANPSSFPFITRVLAAGGGDMQIVAVRALGKIRHPGSGRALVELLKTTRDETLRREILDALAEAVPKDRELAGFIRQITRSPLASPGARAHAVGLLLRLRGEAALDELLADSREETVDQILRSAAEMPVLVARAVEKYAPQYGHLSARTRAALVSAALTQDLEAAGGVLHGALNDPVAEVRRAAYVAIATAAHHQKLFPLVIESLLGKTETSTALEDEVQEAIDRMARVEGAAASVPAALRGRVVSLIGELFGGLREEGRHLSDESHELGWLIVRSKEYVEYYFEEDFKATLLRYLKGASTDTEGDLLKRLKATAVRVEVRHFEGYTALAEIIKNPQRTGMALVARELALTKPGKGVAFWKLVRAIRLARVILAPSIGASVGKTLKTICAWAREEKLFRLAEAALWAFARVDVPGAVAACGECLSPPLASKVLAIASLHLLRELSPSELVPASARLLAAQDDPYVTLNAVEAISTSPASANGDLAKALLTRLSLATNREVVASLSAYLGEKISLDITERLKDMYTGGDAARGSAVLAIMGRRMAAGFPANREGTIEFLYKILRGTDSPRRRAAGVLLWRLRDDYAPQVMKDFLSTGTADEIAETLRALKGLLGAEILPSLAPLLASDTAVIHEPLRELLLGASEELHAGVLDLAIRLRGAPAGDDADPAFSEEPGATVDFRTERKAFQFERENVQDLVILFTDIQGYSKKAQFLAPLQLSTLIQDYERILLALAEAHRGELIKRMGDGHLFVFREPLTAVLAAIRLQKSLRRFNRYRDETSRVVVRVGIHCGKVVRKERGDVLGNTVNIASRLESSAQPGSVLVSEQVHEKVKDYVHAREIGRITVKNISEPIRVYEPYEVALDLPAGLDPLKSGKAALAPATSGETPQAGQEPTLQGVTQPQGGTGKASSVVPVDTAVLREIAACFESLEGLCRDARDGKISLDPINEQVLSPWERLRSRLPV